ncbi:MFS transporter [Myxococcota bacterium]|nr:MFS transporter [Myxococcota bacterium]
MTSSPSVFKSFPRTFWIANLMELFERWAWYGMYGVFAIYLTDPVSKGGLGFSDAQRGQITGVVPFILYLLPIFTGALSDRFGYKRTLLAAFSILTGGYLLMGQVEGYWAMFLVFLGVAVGAAMFKPVISATISHTTDERTGSIGFGIFYAMVNVGGFVGPAVAGILRVIDWDYVFYMASASIALNLVLVTLFFKEPDRGEVEGKSIGQVFSEIGLVFSDLRFVLFLLILSGFWTAFNQIFITLPLFLRDWIDTSVVWCWFDFFGQSAVNACASKDMFNPEWIINIDAGAIIILQIFISALVMRFKPVATIVAGILIAGAGIGLLALDNVMLIVVVGVVVFAIGEMVASPKSTEYIGSIAPRDRKALYMGYSFIPVALGNLFAGLLSGGLYGAYGNKAMLARRYLEGKLGVDAAQIKDLKIDELWPMLLEKSGMTDLQAMNTLYDLYNPGRIWLYFCAIGIGAALALLIYNMTVAKPKAA